MSPIPLVVDTDPGVDDAVALLLAAACPEVELTAVTPVFGNVGLESTTGNARRIMAFAGRADVPIAAGAARPLVFPQAYRAGRTHAEDGLGGRAHTLSELAPLAPRTAVELIADVLRAADRPVTLAAIGPLTNVALLLAAHPDLSAKIARIVVMGGALDGGNITPSAEFNLHCDPEAAHRVLAEESVPVTLVPLDLTLRCAVDSGWLAALASAGPRCAVLGGIVEHYYARYRERYDADMVALHDAVAVLEAALPGALRTEPVPLRVVCAPGERRGAVVREPAAGTRPVDVAMDVAMDGGVPGLRAEILRRLRTLDA